MAFKTLPIELNQNIALQIEDDRTLLSFGCVCKETRAAVHSDRSGIWRRRFLATFDPTTPHTSLAMTIEYHYRRRDFFPPVEFRGGLDEQEKACLHVVRAMIQESCAKASDEDSTIVGNNLRQLRRLVDRSPTFIKDLAVTTETTAATRLYPLFPTVQLALTHLALDLTLGFSTRNFETSQRAAYQHRRFAPLLLDTEEGALNVDWLLHVVNFFRYHLTCKEEDTLYPLYRELAGGERPQGWEGKLKDPFRDGEGLGMLGTHWKGSYGTRGPLLPRPPLMEAAYLDDREIKMIRRLPTGKKVFMDKIDTEAGFQVGRAPFWKHPHRLIQPHQSLKLEPVPPNPHGNEAPEIFGEYFRSLDGPPPSLPTATPFPRPAPHVRFSGAGTDREPFLCEGRLYALPPHEDIPGWRRLVMVKYFPPDPAGDGVGLDPNCLWAYEGAVLPGGKIVVGRWWYPEQSPAHDGRYCGPFLFWEVPRGAEEDASNGNEEGEGEGEGEGEE
ncbi:MAG: hypothetical protein M1832_005896 [Thelocarpon impressellum]|nr:MAG: hypothetical protein M1832_005896 [Thelocarpon impressellum]